MGYAHIENLYRPDAQAILLFRECYALEKIHGTSAHVTWSATTGLSFFSGGCKHEAFVALFDVTALTSAFAALGHADVTVYGEAYGGKMQGMSKTYGPNLRFVAFEVQIGSAWLTVPNAADVSTKLGIEFVHYVKTACTVDCLDHERDQPSEHAFRNGCAVRSDKSTWKIREGVVLRPLIELVGSNGARIMAKHKRPEFSERVTIPNIDPAKRELMEKADEIALEFVTDMRLSHVLDKMGNPSELSAIPSVIAAMVEDVTREASGEIADNAAVRRAIGARTVKLYKALATAIQKE